MLINERRQPPISSRFPGAGKPVYSDYNSITVTLSSVFSQQKGELEVNAVGFDPCDRVVIGIKVYDKRTKNTPCPCEFCGTAEIIIPTPAPANVNEYVVENLRRHSLISSHAVTAANGNRLTWTLIRAGYEIEFTPMENSKGVSPTLTSTITTPASNGSVPTIEDGPAVWVHPTLKASSAMRPSIGSLGWLATPTGGTPRFLGVLRSEDKLTNDDCSCNKPPSSNCHTVIHRGIVHVELEVPLATWPTNPVVAARHTSDPAVNNGKTGGYRIVERGSTAPAGMAILDNVEIWDASGRNAIISLN